jgi:hypothetical protein
MSDHESVIQLPGGTFSLTVMDGGDPSPATCIAIRSQNSSTQEMKSLAILKTTSSGTAAMRGQSTDLEQFETLLELHFRQCSR